MGEDVAKGVVWDKSYVLEKEDKDWKRYKGRARRRWNYSPLYFSKSRVLLMSLLCYSNVGDTPPWVTEGI